MLYAERQRFEKLSVKIGLVFSRLPLTPNQWTVFSLLPALASAYLLASSFFLEAAALFIVASFMDLIDGSVARVTGKVSRFGAYLDTIVDRYVEGLIVLALLFVALPEPGFLPIKAWIFVYFFGGMMTTYVKAAAKEKEIVTEGQELKGGILERAERLIVLFVGILLATAQPLYLSYIVVLLALLANFSALQRIWIAKGMAKPIVK